jgi:hypothetical protein
VRCLSDRNVWVSAASVVVTLTLSAISAEAYMGGPVRVDIPGVDLATNKVYYYRTFNDESGAGPEFWFFDLNSQHPEEAQRAPSLDYAGNDFWREELGISPAWQALSSQITPLGSFESFDLRVRLTADSVGVDTLWYVPIYKGHLRIEEPRFGAIRDLTIFCEPMIVIRGLYEIPGRSEAVIVVSYKGQAYGCEEVDQPILLTAAQARPESSGFEGENSGNAGGPPRAFSFDETPHCCGTSGQFIARLAEIGSPERPVFWYLSLEYLGIGRPAEVWLVSLNRSNPTQPIRYIVPSADSLHGGWETWRTVSRLKGRRAWLSSLRDVDIALHFKTHSIGQDSAGSGPRYLCELAAETPRGAGQVTFTTSQDRIVQIRGVYPLPASADLIVVTHTGIARRDSQEDIPIVLYPK